MEIKQMLAPIIYDGARSGIKRTHNGGVTVHNTGNYSKGAGALNHGTYLQNGGANVQTSWHYTVDDTNIVQSIPSDEVAWHAGDGRGDGNMTTEAIEICVNPDSDIRKATDNAAWLAAQRLKAQGLSTDHLYQHHDWSGKNCPEEIRKGNPYDWATFKAKVASYLGESTTKPTPAPQPSTPSCKYDVGTPVCTNHIWESSTDTGAGFSGDWRANITRVVVGARHPYLIGDGIGWTDDASIDSDPHDPVQTSSKPVTPKDKTLNLPASASSWRVYPTNKAPVVGNECGILYPSKFGGLTYEVLGYPQTNVVTIQTRDYGKVNIYVGAETGAVIK